MTFRTLLPATLDESLRFGPGVMVWFTLFVQQVSELLGPPPAEIGRRYDDG
jgi:hypothetical protein